MGIETILIVLGVAIVIAIWVGAKKAKRAAGAARPPAAPAPGEPSDRAGGRS